jgi:hypothetical protein
MYPHVKQYQGRGPLLHNGARVAQVMYALEVWSNGAGVETILGTVEGRRDLLQVHHEPSFVLRLETGATLPCILQPSSLAGVYQMLATGMLQQPRP